MRLKGLDLSRTYLDEARRHLEGLRGAELIEAAGEKMPLADASADIVTSIFLYHELPPDVRRQVTAEIARVLKPGGLFVFLDSLQMGDRPGWDGLLESFPHALPRALLPQLCHRRSRRHVHCGGPGAEIHVDAVPVQADGPPQARVNVPTRRNTRHVIPASCQRRASGTMAGTHASLRNAHR